MSLNCFFARLSALLLNPAPPSRATDTGIALIRVVAAFAVVLLHAAAGAVGYGAQRQDIGWWGANWMDAACRFCVPIFLMLSGALLLGYQQPDGPFLRKRLKRILVPLLFWSLVYALHGFLKDPQGSIAFGWKYFQYTYIYLRDGIAYHLWYVYMLPGLYLFLPVLNAWIKQASVRQLHIFLGIWGVSTLFTMPWFASIFPHLDLYYFAGYASFMVLGFFLYRFRTTLMHRYRWLPWLLYGVTVAGVAIGTAIVNKNAQGFDGLYYGYQSPLVVLMSIAVFCAGLQFSGKKLPGWVARIDEVSYGMYLAHILLLEYAWKIANDLTEAGLLRIGLAAVLGFIFSFVAMVLLRAIRPIRTWVG
jgi:surface polysaccharide O-acyltransferase-like enzyme